MTQADGDIAQLEVTDEALAVLAGVTPRRIRQLAEAGRLQRTGRNRYRLGDAFAALVEAMSGGDAGAELTRERVRKVRADADLAELEYARAKGLVAPVDEFESERRTFCAVLRANMLNIPTRAVSALLGETDEHRFRQVLRDEIVLALTAAAEYQPEELIDNDA